VSNFKCELSVTCIELTLLDYVNVTCKLTYKNFQYPNASWYCKKHVFIKVVVAGMMDGKDGMEIFQTGVIANVVVMMMPLHAIGKNNSE
jgi:hypothetical protein